MESRKRKKAIKKVIKRRKKALLSDAVSDNKKASLLDRMFATMFSGFVYAQIWEDPEVDIEALKITREDRIFTISSGGCNVMNYLTEDPAHITAIDLNPAHIALLRLKLTAIKNLPDYDTFFRFFGEADSKDNITQYDEVLKKHLDLESRRFWETRSLFGRRNIRYFSDNLYRFGALGRFIASGHRIARILYGTHMRDFMNARDMEDQRRIFDEKFGPLFDKKLVRFACNVPVTLYGLGIPPAQFEALMGDKKGNMADVLKERLERLACDYPLDTNYFAWQAFNRGYDRINRKAVPRYLEKKYYKDLKNRTDKVEAINTTITKHLSGQPENSYDCYVFLDAQDWMNDEQLNELWSEVYRTAKPGARVIFRTAGIDSILPGRVSDEILDCFSYDEAQCKEWTKQDRSSIYGGFHLYTLKH